MQLWLAWRSMDFGYIAEPLAAFRIHERRRASIGAKDGVLSGEQELLRMHADRYGGA